LGRPQLQEFVDVAINSCADLGLADGRALHLVGLLVSTRSIARTKPTVLYFPDLSERRKGPNGRIRSASMTTPLTRAPTPSAPIRRRGPFAPSAPSLSSLLYTE